MKSKISKIKNIILQDHNTDGDYWLYGGNNLIYEILDGFDENDWNHLKNDLNTWKDFEHSIFSRAILNYNIDKIVNKADIYEIFFTEFILQTDLEDADCQIQDVMYIQNIKNPSLQFLNQVKEKIQILSNYNLTTNSTESFENAKKYVEQVISKRHYR
jgi:hypothetical protein